MSGDAEYFEPVSKGQPVEYEAPDMLYNEEGIPSEQEDIEINLEP